MRSKVKKKRIRAAPTQQIIISALGKCYPAQLHDRESFLDSKPLKIEMAMGRSGEKVPFTAVKKSLSRAKSGAVREVLLLDRRHSRVNLPEIGMVAISVSIASLNQEHEKWRGEHGAPAKKGTGSRSPALMKDEVDRHPEPTQELILERIISKAHEWLEQETRSQNKVEGLQLLILDASIVHGSNSFDMLLTILYRELSLFTRFVREVVQRTRHVNSSQTLQVPYRIGFPNVEHVQQGSV